MSIRKDHPARPVDDTQLTVIVDSEPGAAAMARAMADSPLPTRFRVLDRCSGAAADADYLLVLSAASKLDQVAECVTVANKAHRLAAVLVHNDVDANWLPFVLHQSRLRALRNMLVHSDAELPTRILSAWAMGAEHDMVAEAAVIKDRLVIRTCAFEDYSLSFDDFSALQAIPDSARSDFVLEEDGLLLYWPEYQVHLDVDDIRFANDPKRQQMARAERIGNQSAIGTALRFLREQAGLKQSDITGISDRQVRRVESGDRLTVDTLDAFAEAMNVDANVLLERLGELIVELDVRDSESSHSDPSQSGVNDQTDVRDLTHSRASAAARVVAPRVSEPLRLAAASSGGGAPHRWELKGTPYESIRGVIESDFRTDELVFVIDDVRYSGSEPLQASISVWSSRLPEPLASKPFLPAPGTRVPVATGLGLVPRDISRVDLRVINGS